MKKLLALFALLLPALSFSQGPWVVGSGTGGVPACPATTILGNGAASTAAATCLALGTNLSISGGNTLNASGSGGGSVSTTGTPASGNLTKFSAATTITNGDLSGDVTTAGTLATTVVKVNGAVVPVGAPCLASNSSSQLIACTTSAIISGTTGTISGSVANGACDTGTATLTGVTSSMAIVATASSSSGPGAGWSVSAYMSATNTATVQVCNGTGATGSPTSTTYNVRAIP